MAQKEKKAGKTKTASVAKGSASVAQYAVLRRPRITEKAAGLSVDRNRVVFEVDRSATKLDIKAAVQAIYGVEVAKVRTVNVQGKMKRTGNSVGRRQGLKKAYVTVKKGQTIDVVEGL